MSNGKYDPILKALEQNPCEDIISRKSIIAWLEDNKQNGFYDCNIYKHVDEDDGAACYPCCKVITNCFERNIESEDCNV